ncbi:MAG: mechanosensitive ion channel protein MscS [Acidobacteria bacterium]|nr:mechanosensitive ion channel protein MscS [Acidobacteriota bacterium]
MRLNQYPRFMTLSLLVFLTMVLHCTAWGQTAPTSQQAQPGASASPTDPLKRETPYGAVTGFLKAAGQKNFDLAASYLQLPRRKPTARDKTTAGELEAIFNHHYFGSLDLISRDPEGDPSDGLPPDRQSIGQARAFGGRKLDIVLVRVSDPQVGKIWLISADTIKQVPDFYERMQFSALQRIMPEWMNRTEYFNLTVLELVLFLIGIPVAWALARLFLFAAAWVIRRYVGRLTRTGWGQSGQLTKKPIRLALTVAFHYVLVSPVLPLLFAQQYGRVVRILLVIILYFLVSRITDEAAARLEARQPDARKASAHSLMVLGRRVWKVMVALVLLLIVLKSFGFDVNSALAGIGIGGIALGLGAQKTLENLFGGVSVLSDGTMRVGDFCKVGDQVGTVEDIGLRATRVRTTARTVVSIPNGVVATANLENFTGRDKILMNPVITLRYETSADQLRYVIARIREMLYRHPKVESATLRVRFIRLGNSSLDVETFAYIVTSDYAEFLSIQEDLLLRIMDIVEESGTGFAFPSQTTYFGRDPGLDPEKTKAALAAVERWRQEKHIPFPDHDAETIARLKQTLDFPDPDSAVKEP